jgi:hypothetical protein
VRVAPVGVRAPCRVCGREVEALSAGRAAEILEVCKSELGDLVAAGRVHAIPTAGGGIRVCKDSLFLDGDSLSERGMERV